MAGARLFPSFLLAGWVGLHGMAAAQAWPAPTPPGQPPRVALPAPDEAPPAPTLERTAALRASQAAIGRRVDGHTLLDRDGAPVSLGRYRGKPLLVSFVYTGCFQVCPTSTRSLRQALQPLRDAFGEQHFNVISIGFNQPADSPAAMRAFAAQHGIREPNWDFLSPSPAEAPALLQDFGFSYLATPSGFDHVVGVSVVDGEGRLYAQVYGEAMTPDQLGEPLRRLLRGAPPAGLGALEGLAERIRIICTVYDPQTGSYRTDYALILEIVGGLGFMVTVLSFFAVESRRRRRGRLA